MFSKQLYPKGTWRCPPARLLCSIFIMVPNSKAGRPFINLLDPQTQGGWGWLTNDGRSSPFRDKTRLDATPPPPPPPGLYTCLYFCLALEDPGRAVGLQRPFFSHQWNAENYTYFTALFWGWEGKAPLRRFSENSAIFLHSRQLVITKGWLCVFTVSLSHPTVNSMKAETSGYCIHPSVPRDWPQYLAGNKCSINEWVNEEDCLVDYCWLSRWLLLTVSWITLTGNFVIFYTVSSTDNCLQEKHVRIKTRTWFLNTDSQQVMPSDHLPANH